MAAGLAGGGAIFLSFSPTVPALALLLPLALALLLALVLVLLLLAEVGVGVGFPPEGVLGLGPGPGLGPGVAPGVVPDGGGPDPGEGVGSCCWIMARGYEKGVLRGC